jgi:hypothetical protein
MSIYATLWDIKVRRPGTDEWPEVYAQAVPAHIGQPSEGYESDPYAGFLPPLVTPYDPDDDSMPCRAVLIIQHGYHRKEDQRYVEPLLMFTGAEWCELTLNELMLRILESLRPERRESY